MNWDFDRYNGYLEVGGLFATAIIFIYRKVILNFCKWVINLIRVPGGIHTLVDKFSQLERKMNEVELMARASWDAIEKPVWQSDINGLCAHVNRKFTEILECQVSDALGNNWRSFIHQDDRQRVYSEWDMSVAQKRNFSLRYRWVSKTGKVVYVNASASLMVHTDGEIAGWVAFVEVEPPPSTP